MSAPKATALTAKATALPPKATALTAKGATSSSVVKGHGHAALRRTRYKITLQNTVTLPGWAALRRTRYKIPLQNTVTLPGRAALRRTHEQQRRGHRTLQHERRVAPRNGQCNGKVAASTDGSVTLLQR